MKVIKLLWISLFIIWFLFNFSEAKNLFVWSLLGTQIEIWLWQRSNVPSYSELWEWGNALTVYQENKYLYKYDLISELDKASTEEERLQILDQYISYLSSATSNSSQMYNYERWEVEKYKKAAKECEAPIKQKNKDFSAAINSYDYERAEAISQEIADLRACIAKNEVYAKAHSAYASSIWSTKSMQKKAEYLSENKYKIAKYYDILKPDLLKELYNISKTVEANF